MKPKARRPKSQKFSRNQAARLLNMGFSQKEVSSLLNVHKATLNKFVLENNIKTIDQSLSIGHHLKERLSPDQLTWLYSQLGVNTDIIDYLTGLILEQYMKNFGE